ncbi:MAG: acyltransferase family protein [bacterium]|nr:acyltransferase family protein [bacterium]
MPVPMPLSIRELSEDVEERIDRIPTELNEYGYDPFGMSPSYMRRGLSVGAFLYRHYHRVETRGIEKVPEGRVLLIANHAGNTIPMDGAMLAMSMLLEAEPPRLCRGMVEFYLPQIPWWSEMIHRAGAVVGTPENCERLLEHDEAIMVFPEGARGFIKPFSKRYQLQRFGTGFARLALQTNTPIVPVGIVGSEEQSPGLLDSKALGKLIGAPAFPITWFFPFAGVLGFLPLPVKYRIFFGDPVQLEGDFNDDDATIGTQVDRVRNEISLLIEEGLSERKNWFS